MRAWTLLERFTLLSTETIGNPLLLFSVVVAHSVTIHRNGQYTQDNQQSFVNCGIFMMDSVLIIGSPLEGLHHGMLEIHFWMVTCVAGA